MKGSYYNEFEPYCAQWLRNLIAAGLIPAGDVDERDIREVSGDDLKGYGQCHFFAGIGGWAYAGRLAGIPDAEPIWTGSCPCQPLSSAGQHKGHADERHLWPAFHAFIAERRPATVFGEQVASKDGREWLAGVRADLEALGYAVGAADLPAAGVGAPHIRQRLWWVADANGGDAGPEGLQRGGEQRQQPQDRGTGRGLANTVSANQRRYTGNARGKTSTGSGQARPADGNAVDGTSAAGRLGDTSGDRRQAQRERPAPGHTDWSDALWIGSKETRWRRVKSDIRVLAHGVPGRLGKLRAYGNAIVPQVAAEFMQAVMETQP